MARLWFLCYKEFCKDVSCVKNLSLNIISSGFPSLLAIFLNSFESPKIFFFYLRFPVKQTNPFQEGTNELVIVI